ncbi:MAG: hypothetical protein JKY66_04250 [Spongiibacteraceae bacterium]|nr:hypothetical protein [Spongiibacteraceae bacterium]
MLKKLEGKVAYYNPITKRCVQIDISGINNVIELTVSDPWVIRRNDHVAVVGETDPKSGKFIGYAYKNISNGVFGKYKGKTRSGVVNIVFAILFFWAVFPLFINIPIGIKDIALGIKAHKAAAKLGI